MVKIKKVIKLLKKYKAEYGDCLVPKGYVTEDGIRLGQLVQTIRQANRKISEDEMAELNALGFVWKVKQSTISFNEIVKLLKEYKKEHGNCMVPISYITENGIHLGRIVYSIRRGSKKTSEEEKAELNALGFAWKVNQSSISFEKIMKLLEEYKKEQGDCLVPYSYTTKNGVGLGHIVHYIRGSKRKTSEEEIARLNALGFVWKINQSSISSKEAISLLKAYKAEHGDCFVPGSYITEDGIHLGYIVLAIRQGARKLSEEEKAELNDLGFAWKVRQSSISVEEAIKLLKEYKSEHGDCLVPYSYITKNGIGLGRMMHSIRQGIRKISEEERAELNALGFVWRIRQSSISVEEAIKLLKEYKSEYGDCLVPYSYITKNGVTLGHIVSSIRQEHRKITEEEKKKLNDLGFAWKVR